MFQAQERKGKERAFLSGNLRLSHLLAPPTQGKTKSAGESRERARVSGAKEGVISNSSDLQSMFDISMTSISKKICIDSPNVRVSLNV